MVHFFYVLLRWRDFVAEVLCIEPSDRDIKLQAIKDYVWRERMRSDITILGYTYRFELGCWGCGEFFNLVECQLLSTKEGYGGWQELKHDGILDGGYEYVTKGRRG